VGELFAAGEVGDYLGTLAFLVAFMTISTFS